jgi:tRNA (guanine26-N2/guanine27-N2)-dimethyltransferase
MLIGAAVKEGAARGLSLTPLFSLYSYHGPVFRVMLQVERSSEGVDTSRYGFVGHCYVHGENCRVGWKNLSQAWCR